MSVNLQMRDNSEFYHLNTSHKTTLFHYKYVSEIKMRMCVLTWICEAFIRH